MANVQITQLPAAGGLTGSELVPIVQDGVTVRTTTAAIAASPSLTQTFLTLNNEPTLTNSRFLSVGTGLGLTDNGAQSNLVLNLTGAAGSLEAAGNGVIVKTASNTVVARTLTASGNGLSITNGSGVSGAPTFALTGLPEALANLTGGGILASVDPNTIAQRTITGTASQIDVADGDGVLDNPTISIADNPVIPGVQGMALPAGTTGNRSISPINGTIRYNTDTATLEGYANNTWGSIAVGVGVTSVNVSGGTTGLTTSGGPITSVGTITFAGTLITANGGTGLSSYTAGDTLYYAAGDTFSKLSIGTNGQVMTSSGTAPQWTNQSSLAVGTATNVAGGGADRIVYNTGANATSFIVAPTVANTFLEWSGSAFQWSVNPLGTVTSVDVSGGTTGLTTSGGPITTSGTITLAGTLITSNGGTGVTSYTAGDTLFYASGTALNKLAIGSSTFILTSTGTAPQWSNPTGITVGSATSATTATNIAGGAAGSIPYQTGSGVTAMLATSAGVLVGGATPSYSTAPALTGTNFTSIPNAALQNSAITIGTTAISLGGTSLTLGGLTSVAVTQDPTTALQLATKQYVDGLVTSGVTYHAPVKYEVPSTTGNLNATYNNGAAGVGATLTNAGTLAAFAPDGPTAQVGDRILVYNQTNQFENGVYEVSTVGNGSTAWVLTRTADADSYALKDPNALGDGDAFFVTSGNTGAGELYVCNTTGAITFGTTPITFVQVSSAQIYSAGTGLTLAGTQFSLTVPVVLANGGTGLTSYTAGDLPYFASGTAFSKLAIGATDRILTSTGTAPQWVDPSTVSVGTATNATNIGITNDTSTNATMYPVWVTANTGNLPAKVTSTKLSFNPSTGVLTATGGISGGTF